MVDSPLPSIEYHDPWTCLYDSRTGQGKRPWGRVHRGWWGTNSQGKMELDRISAQGDSEHSARVIRPLDTRELQQDLEALGDSDGHIYVRPEYQVIKTHLATLYENSGGAQRTPARVIIEGQPGIGKSYCAVYLVFHCMVEGTAVIFSTRSGYSFLFDEYGVWRCKKDEITCDHLPPSYWVEGRQILPWSIIDANDAGKDESSRANSPHAFCILATSPQKDRYRSWTRAYHQLEMIYVNPWSLDEVVSFLSDDRLTQIPSEGRYPYFGSQALVEALIAEVGPCIRDIVAFLHDKQGYECRLKSIIASLNDPQEIRPIFDNARRNANALSDSFVLIRRKHTAITCQDLTIDFKTRKIAYLVSRHLQTLSLDYTKAHLRCVDNIEGLSIFAGMSFEDLFTRYISGKLSSGDLKAFGVFEAMNLAPTSRSKKRFQHFRGDLDYRTDVLDVYHDRRIKATSRKRQAGEEPTILSNPPSFPRYAREIVPYNDIQEVLQASVLNYYLPSKRNNPFFDGFLLQRAVDHTVIWVFQLTIANQHAGGATGFELLQTLKENVEAYAGHPVKLKYVLVAPFRHRQVVNWHLPNDCSAQEGNVYVQYLDLKPYHHPEEWDLFATTIRDSVEDSEEGDDEEATPASSHHLEIPGTDTSTIHRPIQKEQKVVSKRKGLEPSTSAQEGPPAKKPSTGKKRSTQTVKTKKRATNPATIEPPPPEVNLSDKTPPPKESYPNPPPM
ncbi:hypothetical protein EST38_g2419 [Candolleomyces aberdarensis]|uniref:Uncharacterized protein n=1 Tax=Candolleomyces aberdarensis TaxID=2316362 RepID=A0A4Q2DSG9_9AGAR|nr:hypothetical protein EST38_g2419 [Candolleomyces aberdarensis]